MLSPEWWLNAAPGASAKSGFWEPWLRPPRYRMGRERERGREGGREGEREKGREGEQGRERETETQTETQTETDRLL